MCAAIALGNVVGEAQNIFMVAVVPPHSHFNRDTILFAFDGDWLINQCFFRSVKVTHIGFQTALIEHFFLFDFWPAPVRQQDANT
ncbi:hypothetical protein D3C80_1423350 [compost metagenome]